MKSLLVLDLLHILLMLLLVPIMFLLALLLPFGAGYNWLSDKTAAIPVGASTK